MRQLLESAAGEWPDVRHSRDLDETRQIVAGLYCDHRLDHAGRRGSLDYRHAHHRMGAFSFCRMRYGAEVSVQPGKLSSFYLVQVPLAGRDDFRVDGKSWCADPVNASVHAPDSALSMRWSADCEKFVIRIDRAALDGHVDALLGEGAARGLSCPPLVDLRDGGVRAWVEMASHVFGELRRNPRLAEVPLLRNQFEQLLLTTALSWLPIGPAFATGERRRLLPRHVKMAEDFMRANVESPLTVEMVAREVGVSGRTLYDGFRRFLGVSPMRYLRDLRMARARADLLDPHQPSSVTAVATRWGFFQLGRFAVDYRRCYGEAPHTTLAKRP